MLFIPAVMLMVFSELAHLSVNQFGYSDTDSSYFKNPPCPNAEDIAPCTCNVTNTPIMPPNVFPSSSLSDVSEKVEISCKGIEDEQQLYEIFHRKFPVKVFDKLYIETYLFDTLSDDVFGDIKFKTVFTPNYGMGRLRSVGPSTFMKMSSELTLLSLGYNNFSTFPIETLDSYPKLWYLSLRESPLESFPIIQSDSLIALDVSHGKYEEIPIGAFNGMPNLEYVTISSYNPMSISKGVFKSLSKLKGIEIVMSEGLKHISSYQFEVNSNEPVKIDLRHNGIQTVDADAFKGLKAGSTIDMEGNNLRNLPDATWRWNYLKLE